MLSQLANQINYVAKFMVSLLLAQMLFYNRPSQLTNFKNQIGVIYVEKIIQAISIAQLASNQRKMFFLMPLYKIIRFR